MYDKIKSAQNELDKFEAELDKAGSHEEPYEDLDLDMLDEAVQQLMVSMRAKLQIEPDSDLAISFEFLGKKVKIIQQRSRYAPL